jgi:hypothetical protein
MVFALTYLLVRRLVRLLAGPVGDLSSDVEVVVLRQQLMVLKRQVGRPRLRRRDRLFMAAISRALPRVRWSMFVVSPQTLLRWLWGAFIRFTLLAGHSDLAQNLGSAGPGEAVGDPRDRTQGCWPPKLSGGRSGLDPASP